jgi:hypothetical protein
MLHQGKVTIREPHGGDGDALITTLSAQKQQEQRNTGHNTSTKLYQ